MGKSKRVAWTGIATLRIDYPSSAVIFSQGEIAPSVLFLERGRVRLSVVSESGKEAVIAVLDAQNFFGEGCLAGQPKRMATATSMGACRVLSIEKNEMQRQLKDRPAFS